ncbi:hypothetical protein, partial [Halalkalibacterium ligniniphilum]|uniref:hypothetical protein n=1 Tax=Halalkalibacterium ligniniphilum TaxID=1134413 RepID=UPI00055116B1
TTTEAVVEGTTIDAATNLNNYDFTTTNSKTFDVNDTTITLDTDVSDLDGLVAEINSQLETAGSNVTVAKNEAGDGLVFTSTEDITLSGADLSDFGLTADTTAAEEVAGGTGTSGG